MGIIDVPLSVDKTVQPWNPLFLESCMSMQYFIGRYALSMQAAPCWTLLAIDNQMRNSSSMSP